MKEFDVLLAGFLVNENIEGGLKGLSSHYFKYPQEHFAEVVQTVPGEVKKEFGLKASNKATFDLVLIEDGCMYALDDAFQTWNAYLLFLDLLEEEGMTDIFWKHSMPFSKCLYKMEKRGVTIDLDKLHQMRNDMDKDIEDLFYEMTEILGAEFNPKSSMQLAEILFGYVKENKESLYGRLSFRFPIQTTTGTGAPQTNELTLRRISQMSYKNSRKLEGIEFVKKLMSYKKLVKLRTAFIEGLEEQVYEDGKAHASMNQTGTDSGRISMSTPKQNWALAA